MAANGGVVKAVVNFYQDSYGVLRSTSIYSAGTNFDWLIFWKCWPLAGENDPKKVFVEESNTRLEKWRAT